MKRRQFLQAMTAVAAVLVAPFRDSVETHSIWIKSHDAKVLRHAYKRDTFAQMYGFRGTVTGRFSGTTLNINFSEIERRVAARLLNDGKFHQYAQNSHGQMFFDGKIV